MWLSGGGFEGAAVAHRYQLCDVVACSAFVGVDVFFVISGFLITGMLWREVSTTGTVRLGRFYGARARRLLPASAAVGVITAIGSVILLSPLEAREVIRDGIASALYVGNYRFALQGIDYFAADRPPSPFQHYWSLGVEEQFYLVWAPMFIGAAWLTRRAPRRTGEGATASTTPYLFVLALVAAASFAVSLVATHKAPPVAFFSLPTRAWQLAVGGLVALTATQWRRLPPLAAALAGWAGLAVILLACIRLGASTPYPGSAALLPVLGTALVIGAARYNIAAGFTSYDPAWIDSMTRLVQQLRGTGAQVLVLGPIPDPQSEVPTCLSVHLDDVTACSPLRSVAVNECGIAAEAAAVKAGGGQYADLTELFCTTQRCPVIIGHTLAYWDRKHTTIEYAGLLAPVLGALVDRALVRG